MDQGSPRSQLGRAWGRQRQHLAGVHEAQRVQCSLHSLLHGNMRLAVLAALVLHLPHTYAVLSRYGAATLDRVGDHMGLEGFHRLHVFVLVWHQAVEVPIGNVGADDALQPQALGLSLGVCHAFRQPRDGHAYVRDEDLLAALDAPVADCREVAASARLPDLVQLVAVSGPLNVAGRATVGLRELGEDIEVALQGGLVIAPELEKERRLGLELGAEHGVCDLDALRIEQLAAQKRRGIGTHSGYDSVHCGLHIREGQQASAAEWRLPTHAHSQLADDSQGTLTAHVELCQLVPRGRLTHLGTRAHDVTLGSDDKQGHHVLLRGAVAQGRHATAACGRHAAEGRV
mmetsp:Transcript_79050/g.207519  ORF Transcript_79050/g.207519 Transcript_79050/m.207519 type:complete len:344 (-) Transcript_79050:523-1554(-)